MGSSMTYWSFSQLEASALTPTTFSWEIMSIGDVTQLKHSVYFLHLRCATLNESLLYAVITRVGKQHAPLASTKKSCTSIETRMSGSILLMCVTIFN